MLASTSTGDTMSRIIGCTSRARALSDLFAAWKRAFDLQDTEIMAVARRTIDCGQDGARGGRGGDPELSPLRELCSQMVRDIR